MWGLGGILIWSVVLSAYDIAYRRLPDWLTLPAGLVAIVVAVIVDKRSLIGLLWPALYLAVAWRGGGIGGGDLKLAVPLGVWVAHNAGVLGTAVAMALASTCTVILVASLAALKRASTGEWALSISVAHGPAMLCAAWAVVLATGDGVN